MLSLAALISNAGPEDQAVATVCSYLFRFLGSVIGIFLGATVFQQRLRESLVNKLGKVKDVAEIEDSVKRSLVYLKQSDQDVRRLVRQAHGKAVTRGCAQRQRKQP